MRFVNDVSFWVSIFLAFVAAINGEVIVALILTLASILMNTNAKLDRIAELIRKET